MSVAAVDHSVTRAILTPADFAVTLGLDERIVIVNTMPIGRIVRETLRYAAGSHGSAVYAMCDRTYRDAGDEVFKATGINVLRNPRMRVMRDAAVA